MKNRLMQMFPLDAELEVVAVFGGSRVVRLRNGRLEIRGGEPADRAEAREWTSLFCHEALPSRR